jgi:hypothetical protein
VFGNCVTPPVDVAVGTTGTGVLVTVGVLLGVGVSVGVAVGGVTVTLNVQLAVFWLASVAVQVMTVVPAANADPLGGVQVATTPGQLSEADGGS